MGLDMENEQLWLEAQQAYEQGNLPVAAQLFGQLHQADPAHFMPLRMLGVIAGQQGMHDETLELMGQALARAPHDPAIQADYANALRNVGRLDEALDILNNLLGQDANFTQALDYRGAVVVTCTRSASAASNLPICSRAQPRLLRQSKFCGSMPTARS